MIDHVSCIGTDAAFQEFSRGIFQVFHAKAGVISGRPRVPVTGAVRIVVAKTPVPRFLSLRWKGAVRRY